MIPIGIWDTWLNILFLLFWLRIWHGESRDNYFNPYMARFSSISDHIFKFLEPVFFGASIRATAGISLICLLIFRALLIYGNQFLLSIGPFKAQVSGGNLFDLVVFSFLSFGVFVLRIWGLAFIYLSFSSDRLYQHTSRLLRDLALPFSRINQKYRPVAFVLIGMILFFPGALVADGWAGRVNNMYMAVFSPLTGQSAVLLGWRLFLVALGAFLSVAQMISSIVFILIIASIIGTLMGRLDIISVCNDWIELFLGPLRKYPIRFGSFDLTPLLFLIVLGVIESLLSELVINTYLASG